MGTEFHFGKMKKVLELEGGDGSTISWVHLIILNCTLKNGCGDNSMLCVLFTMKTLKKPLKMEPKFKLQ